MTLILYLYAGVDRAAVGTSPIPAANRKEGRPRCVTTKPAVKRRRRRLMALHKFTSHSMADTDCHVEHLRMDEKRA